MTHIIASEKLVVHQSSTNGAKPHRTGDLASVSRPCTVPASAQLLTILFPIAARYALLLITLLLPFSTSAQTLARPGWAGSGMTLEPWWTHAIFYEIDPHSFATAQGQQTANLRGIIGKLDYIHSLGADAITLTHFTAADESKHSPTIDPALGTLDDFDDLVRDGSRNGIRLLVELDPATFDSDALSACARLWLTHGAAGISLRTEAPATTATASPDLHSLRQLIRSFPGQRILVAAANPGNPTHHADAADLTLSTALASIPDYTPAGLRAALASQGIAAPLVALTDLPGQPRSASRGTGPERVLATLLLATRANAQLLYGQELGLATDSSQMPWGTPADASPGKHPQPTASLDAATEDADPSSLLNWYRHLIDLHHGNATLRAGSIDLLNHDDQGTLIWVTRRGTASLANPAIVVVCNLSGKPVTLNLTDDMSRLHLRGNFLRTILRSDPGMGGLSLNAVTLPSFAVYLGELRY